MGKWQNYHRLSYEEQLERIKHERKVTNQQIFGQLRSKKQPPAAQLIENYLMDFELPEGIVTNLVVDGQEYIVPMVIEEPSVVAAACNGAKMVAQNGGFSVDSVERTMIGQILMVNASGIKELLMQNKGVILKAANVAHPTALKYGRGAFDLEFRKLSDDYGALEILVDPGESMGANLVNTMCEAVAQYCRESLHLSIVAGVLTNLATRSLITVHGTAKIGKSISGREARGITELSEIAQIDPSRAATHNKGIMNGIDAVLVATGNDWRAIESGIHAYAARNGRYQGLSQWSIEGDFLTGTLTVPLPLGVVGGATAVLPKVKVNQELIPVASAKELMTVVASLGLAQNLAALKALAGNGIQAGHMKMQLRSLAISAGARSDEVEPLIKRTADKSRNLATFKEELERMRKDGGYLSSDN